MTAIVTLLTDFGVRDWYVAAMKARILEGAPQARLVDITHAIPPGAVEAAAFVLAQVHAVFPSPTIHLAVVDPGVGSARAAIAVRVAGACFVGPDNGIFHRVLAGRAYEAVVLDGARVSGGRPVSATFHGRDLFAPAAGMLAAGRDLGTLGEPVRELVAGVGSGWEREQEALRAVVLWVDRFGNCLTDLPRAELQRLTAPVRVRAGRFAVDTLVRTFSDVADGQPLAYLGSGGTLELGVRGGNAAESFGLDIGSTIEVHSFQPEGDGK